MEEKCIYEPGNNNLHGFFESFPPGYRFSPEDQELVLDFLEKKVRNEKLPENNFVHINIYNYHPETLARKFRHFGVPELYCFTPRERKYKNGERPRKGAAGGFWKATGADKQALFKEKVVGHKKSPVFYDGKPPNGEKTNWIMHEYRLGNPSRVPAKDRYPDTTQARKWRRSISMNPRPTTSMASSRAFLQGATMEEKRIYEPETNDLHGLFESFPPGYRFTPDNTCLIKDRITPMHYVPLHY